MENGALRGATGDVIEVEVDTLGIAVEHLVRSIDDAVVYELVLKDESKWEPIEIRPWPVEWKKPDPQVLYHVVSGNHRTSAARIKQLRTLRARLIETDNRLSYLVAAIGSNLSHGKNFTKEEYIENAKELKKEGMSLGEIASFLGYNKSTVSRWFTGSDSHAAAKRETEQQSETPLPEMPHVSGPDAVRQKVMGLVMEGRIDASVTEARAYISTLKQSQQESLHCLFTWLQEVING